jgi:hypothetical protein
MTVVDGVTGATVSEDRVQAAMRALELILDEPAGLDADWDTHLRRLAVAAIEAEPEGLPTWG